MKLFRRKRQEAMRTCPRCTQLLGADELDCPMCGADLRELHVATPASSLAPPREAG